MHLRDADLLRDLCLRQTLFESHTEYFPFALRKSLECGLERCALLGPLELLVLGADRLHRVVVVVVATTARPARERDGRIGRAGFHRFEHLLRRRLEFSRDLGDRRRALELDRQALDRAGHLRVELLQAARHPDGPALVAEVALDLADHVRRRVGGERDLALEVVAVDRLQQADRADLLDVLERLAAAGVAPRERPHQREVALHELLASARVAANVVALEQLAVGLGRAGWLGRRQGRATRLFRMTMMLPSSAISTPNEST